jgi:hypothetical protein
MDAGRPDLARDRLTGYLYTLHRRAEYNQEAYALLGEAYFAMREYAHAGAAWLLTERQGADVDTALQAFHKRYGTEPAAMLHAVKPRAPSEDYPPQVQERLKGWGYRFRPYRPRSNPHVIHSQEQTQPQTGLRPIEMGCLLAAGLLGLAILSWLFLPR